MRIDIIDPHATNERSDRVKIKLFNPIPVHVFRIRAKTIPHMKRKRQGGAKVAPGVLE